MDDSVADVEARLVATFGRFYVSEGSCITVVSNASVDVVLAALGGDPGRAQVRMLDALEEEEAVVALAQRDGAVLAVEPNGLEGSREVVLRQASAQGRAGSMFWTPDGLTTLSLAESGEVLFSADIAEDQAPDPGLEEYFGGGSFGEDDGPVEWVAYGLGVIERFTNVRFGGPMLPQTGLVHVLEPYPNVAPGRTDVVARGPRPAAEVDLDTVTRHSLEWTFGSRAFGDPAIIAFTAVVLGATDERRRQVAALAVRRALRAVGLEDHPELRAVLGSLDVGSPLMTPGANALIRKGRRLRGDGPTPPRYFAFTSLMGAFGADPINAALDAVFVAGFTLQRAGESPESLLAEASGVLQATY